MGHQQTHVPMSGLGMQPGVVGVLPTGMGMGSSGMGMQSARTGGMNLGGGMGPGYSGTGYSQQGPGVVGQFQPGYAGGMMGVPMNSGMQQLQRPF